MDFLRSVYNALAVIGTVALSFLAFFGVAAFFDDWSRAPRNESGPPPSQIAAVERRQERARQAASAQPAISPYAPPPTPLGRPMGITEAQSRGLLHDADSHVILVINDRPVPGARKAWVERHGRDLYLLVSDDSFLIDRPPSGGRWALQLRDGRRIPFAREAANGGRLAYSRLCDSPPEGLLVVAVPSDSFRNSASVECQ